MPLTVVDYEGSLSTQKKIEVGPAKAGVDTTSNIYAGESSPGPGAKSKPAGETMTLKRTKARVATESLVRAKD